MIKSLTIKGKIILSDKPRLSVSNYIYSDIQKSLKTLKAYRLQLDTLGYIVDQGIKDRSVIMAKVNKQVDRQTKTPPINNNNRSLVIHCYLRGTITTSLKRKYDIALSIDHSLKCTRVFDATIIEFARMIRKRRKKGLSLGLKDY